MIYVTREAEQLPEPLADSVLQHGQQRLQKNIDEDEVSSSITELEDAMHMDSMAQLTHGNTPQMQHMSSIQKPQVAERLPLTNPTCQAIVDSSRSLAFDPPESDQSVSHEVLCDYSTSDWSNWSVEMFPATMLSIDDLFGGN